MKQNPLPRVLVLLAAYNGEKYIKEQLESILAQRGVLVEIVISLDISTDNSFEFIKEFSDMNENVTLLPSNERFGSAGKNFFHLIKNAELEGYSYFAFADQDDIWLPEKLESAINEMLRTQSDGYSSNVTAFWENGKTSLIKKDYSQTQYDYLFESPGPGCTFVMTYSLFSKTQEVLVRKYSSIDKVWLHDWFCYSLARFWSFKWYIDSNPHMLYRQHGSNEVGANFGISAFIERTKVMLSGDGLKQVVNQADFLSQTSCPPIKSLLSGRFGALCLAFSANKLRRKKSHKLFCFFYFLTLFFLGNKIKAVLR